jgi:hypothetical protein
MCSSRSRVVLPPLCPLPSLTTVPVRGLAIATAEATRAAAATTLASTARTSPFVTAAALAAALIAALFITGPATSTRAVSTTT